ncbi:hypothetical protein CJF32_00003978 [Rutstroemia sp. NJR-2017a WRK4]|nr:hypothetical protein CJF32_00003978 [Rutstroemia sp. NJR-2017a WRK4]
MDENSSRLNDPPSVLAGPQLLHDLIQWNAHPNACALDFILQKRRETYRYQDIQACVAALVTRIQVTLEQSRLRTQRQHIVPILLPQSPALYISELAILQSGGAFCPINLDAPKDRIKFVVGDVSADIIITTAEFQHVVSWENGPQVVVVDEFPSIPLETEKYVPSRETTPNDLAYVMYTSGSSGTPKGVAVSHLAVSQSLLAHENIVPSFDRFLQFAAPSFDVSVFEIFFPFIRGRTLVGCDRSQLLNDLQGMINKLEIDAAELTPTVVGALLRKRSNVPGLKLLMTIGEMLTRPIVEEFGGSETRESILYGMYGPTEAAIHCTVYPKMQANTKYNNIGVPFETVSAFIAKASSTSGKEDEIILLPRGELGELVLGGAQLAQGYLNREEQNRAAFINVDGKKYYRTGDKARILTDGSIEIHGRMSAGQVKLRGQRVELGEIEDAVYKHSGIKTVVAVVLGTVLVAFALVDDSRIQPEEVLHTCSRWLPNFMVPSEVVLLDQFPYLPSGKVDKRKLEFDYQQNRELADDTVESTLVEARLGRGMRLAAAGVDSLVAIKVASGLRSRGFEVTTISVLQAETFSSLVQICETSTSEASSTTISTPITDEEAYITVQNNDEDFEITLPCTPLQNAMLAETALNKRAYRNWVEIELPGMLDPEHIRKTLHSLAMHNPILRTGFSESSDAQGYVQLVWKAFPDSNIEEVETFTYEFDDARDISLDHPVSWEILAGEVSSKLLLHIHHALYDAWSLELMLDDLELLLRSESLPARPSFAEFVYGYIDEPFSIDTWESKDYWKDHLADLELRHMPNFNVTKNHGTGLAVAHHSTQLDTSMIENAAKSLSVSPQAIFQAAYSLILSSYLGSSDICFGTVFSGRTLSIRGIENIVGPCLTTLPIRVDISTISTLRDLVEDLNHTTRKHLGHSNTPLRDIQSAIGVEPRQTLFDTLLIWQQTLHSYDHTREHVVLVDQVDQLEFNLTLEITPTRSNVHLKANFEKSIFPSSQIDLLLHQVEQVAKVILENSTEALNNVFEKLHPSVLSIENPTPNTALGSETLSSPVERIAQEDPERPAIAFAESIDFEASNIQYMTYGSLNRRANQFAHYMADNCVLPNEIVCICLEKSHDFYASVLATTKIGAGYLPVTPDVPQERLRHILLEAKVKLLIGNSRSASLPQDFADVRKLYLDEVDWSSFPVEDLPPAFNPDYLSYCVFTSGSTGTPKGVMVTQGNLVSNLDVLVDLYPASKDSRLLQACSQAFDVSVFEIFFTWRIGGCLCSATKDVLFRDIEHAIRVLDVTHLSLTPTVAALIDSQNVPKVEFLVTAGEAVTQKVFNMWADHGLYQGYGPSETTNICTVKSKVSQTDYINNIGHPFRNTSAFVLARTPEFQLVPRGGEGEFCFGGSQVFRGYMDRVQEEGKIIDHPEFGRLYRSGDFGRLMPDGSLAFTGRKDDQVKIRGQRVELGEISSILLSLPYVLDCVTMVITSEDNSQRLVCFWALTSNDSENSSLDALTPDQTTIQSLYKELQSRLPHYMVPSALIPVSQLPSTPQGKIDKRRLVNLYQTLDLSYLNLTIMESRSALDHNWTEFELEIRNVLSKVTSYPVDDINPDTSFFSLGIDSISAVKFSKYLRDMTGRQVEISDILKHSSVVRLAERMSAFQEMDSHVPSSTESSFNFDSNFMRSTMEDFTQMGIVVETITPCTPLQEAMLSAAESSSRSAYSNHVLLNISGDIQKLCACWQEMVKRHEILRTCFLATDMPQFAYVQAVLKDFRIDFGSLEASTRDDAIHEVQMRPAKSQYAPPYTIDILQLAGQTKMIVSMHHALYDGVALAVLYEEVENLYHQSQLAPSLSFTPFLKYMTTTDSNSSDQFWQECLRGYFPVSLESISETAISQQTGSRVQKLCAKVALSWIEKYTRKNNTTILSLFHAVWTKILSQLLSSTDVCFGNVVSGRTVPVDGVERLVAPCFNTIPTRVKDIHKLTYLETFRNLQSFNANSLAFQLTPLRRLQTKFSPDGSRLFDTLFILQQPPKDLDSSIWSIEDDVGAMDFPLVCEVVPRHSDDTLEIILHSHFSHISEEGADKILQDFDRIIQAALENPRQQILSSSVREIIMSRSEERARKTACNAKPETQSSPMNPKELEVRDIISAFTDVPSETITRDASIFRLGLDSISAVQVAARLRAQGYTILASDILQRPTISRIADFISAHAEKETKEVKQFDFASFDTKFRDMVCSKHGIPLTDVEFVRPCTAVQAGMIAQTLHSGGQDYVNSVTLELSSGHSLEKVKQSWSEVCKAHEMLRTGFSQTDDSIYPFVMVTYTAQSFTLPWYEGQEDIPLDSVDQIRPPWSLKIIERGARTLLQLKAHHALYDAQSMQIIFSDFAIAYNSRNLTARPSVNLLLGPILQASVVGQEEKRSFWGRSENRIVVNKFPDLTPLRVLETNHAVQELKSAVPMIELENTCRKIGVTVQAAGQATWARLLMAYTGENVTTFGITLSGRSVCDAADSIAFPSIVTLPVNCDVTGTNADLLSRTMAGNAQLHEHQFTPLTSIQKWAGYPEGKIFDTLFAYQKLPDNDNASNPPWKVIEENATVDYVVSLEMQPSLDGALTLRLTFRDDVVPWPHADFILRQFDMLLMDTLQNPSNSCDVAPEAVAELLSITPAQEPVLPDSITLLHEYVERGAKLWPSKPALEFATCLEKNKFESQKWTYEQLNAEANKVANLVQNRGAVPGEIVAVCFDKCPEASFAIIGIMKAGCAYVALDPNAPADRLNFIIEDSSAKLVISAGRPAQNLGSCMIKNVVDLSDSAVLRNCTTEPVKLPRHILPSDISYCLYTSGTTGTPKGCLLTHENAVQAMLAFQRLFAGHWTEESKWLQFASFHFDVSVLEQFWSWSVGICVASAPRDLIFEDIPGAIQQLCITHIDLTPSLARLLHPDDVPTLWKGVFITGGEQLKQEILDVWGEKGCIYNGYGPTEATIGVTMYPRVPKDGKPSNIGPQFVNVGSFVLKPGTELPVLRGGIGELCVSGKLVGKGYLNRPDLTRERFPTLTHFNERVYRTGDLVRILHDGTFLFLGRADDQVKLRGQRLELGEINEVIKKSRDDLDEVVTLVLKHITQAKEQLVTFFVLAGKNQSDAGEAISVMRDACKARLPGYMVPTHFVPIEALPLNANNKADSKQLAALYNKLTVEDLQRLRSSNRNDTEWNDAEKRVINVIASVMSVEVSVLSRSSNLFELGLDSISIISFSRALQNSGYENAKLSIVKSNPNIGRLVEAIIAGTLDRSKETAHIAATQEIAAFAQRHVVNVCRELGVEASDVESIAPCTPMQEGMIYRFLQSEKALYFNKFRYRLADGVDTERLMSAWRLTVTNLQVLRTKFVATDDGFAQVVLKSGDFFAHEVNDYETIDKSVALRSPWSFEVSSSTRGSIVDLRIFHGLYDGNSMGMMLRCLLDAYNGSENVQYGPLFHSSLPHGPLAKVIGAEEFWKNHLKTWSHQLLTEKDNATNDVRVSMELENLKAFEKVRKNLQVAPQAMIQAAWVSVIQKIMSPRLTIGLVTSGRAMDFEGAEKVIGPLFNTVPFNVDIVSGTEMQKLIQQCHGFNMKMQDYQHTPLKDIQKWSSAKPGQSLFDTLFVFQRAEMEEESFAKELWVEIEDDDENIADYPLAFEATLNHDSTKLTLTLVSKGAVMTTSEANDILEQVSVSIGHIVDGENDVISTSLQNDASETTVDTAAEKSPALVNHSLNDFPWTKEAQIIRTEIASLAKLEEANVHEHSSIFELGLDSIDVIKLSSRIRNQGIQIPVSLIIKCRTIANMCSKISTSDEMQEGHAPGKRLEELRGQLNEYLHNRLPDDVEDVLPATPLQQSMVNEMIKSGFKRYFNIEVFELNEGVNAAVLKEAVDLVVSRSPILRTTFVEVDDPRLIVSYAQVVHSELPKVSLPIKPAGTENIDDFMARANSELVSTASNDGGLFQAHFVTVKGTRFMIMAISHALYDGRSLRTIHEDITRAYRGVEISRPNSSPFLEQVFESTTDEARNFWKSTLSNLPVAVLPKKDLQVPELQVVHRLERQSKVSLSKVEALCKSSRITLQTLGQTCWALVLAQLMGQLDVVFGTVLSCRDTEEADQVMFPLMNTVAVRSVLHGTFGEMLKYMQDMSDTTRQYQHFPLGTAQAYALASRNDITKDTTLFDTLFIYQGRRQNEDADPLYRSVQGTADVEFPICVEIEIVDDKYLAWTTACKAVARDEEETVELLDSLDAVLERIVDDVDENVITTDDEGVSVCGLPKFQLRDTNRDSTSKRPREEVSSEWSQVELDLRKALHEISGVAEDNIFKDSTIFHLGLDSILVLKLPALLRKYGIRLGISDILKHLTIEAMAESLKGGEEKQESVVDVDAVLTRSTPALHESTVGEMQNAMGEIQYVMPATAGQVYMIRHWQNSQGLLFYPTFNYRLNGNLEKEKLNSAWKTWLQRHDILRTGFVEQRSKLIQFIFKDPPNEIVYVEEGDKMPAKCKMGHLNHPPLNLAVRKGNDSDAGVELQLTIHHALYDGISLPILISELQALYHDQSLPNLSLSFKNFVARTIASADTATAKENWTSYLSGAIAQPPSPPLSNKNRSELFHTLIPAPNLRVAAQKAGVSIDHLLLASVARLYSKKLSNEAPTDKAENPDVLLGIYLANRAPHGEDLSHLAAPTLNLLPLKISANAAKLEDTAQCVQRDLGMLSEKGMTGVGLDDIYSWTGRKVGIWVNILRGVDENAGNERGWEQIIDAVPRERVLDVSVSEEVNEKLEKRDEEAFCPAIDVEMRYNSKDQTLDMGVFAPEELMGLQGAREWVREVGRLWG